MQIILILTKGEVYIIAIVRNVIIVHISHFTESAKADKETMQSQRCVLKSPSNSEGSSETDIILATDIIAD